MRKKPSLPYNGLANHEDHCLGKPDPRLANFSDQEIAVLAAVFGSFDQGDVGYDLGHVDYTILWERAEKKDPHPDTEDEEDSWCSHKLYSQLREAVEQEEILRTGV